MVHTNLYSVIRLLNPTALALNLFSPSRCKRRTTDTKQLFSLRSVLVMLCICKFMHKVGFIRQKMKLVSLQRDEEIRAQFTSDVSIYKPEMLDQRLGLTDVTASVRPVPSQIVLRGEHISAIAFMSVYGFLDCHTVTGTVNAMYSWSLLQKHYFLISCHLMEKAPQRGDHGELHHSSWH